MAHYSSKRKIWEFTTFNANQNVNLNELKCEEIFNLEIEISNLKQSLMKMMTINKKKKFLKKLKNAEKKLLEFKGLKA